MLATLASDRRVINQGSAKAIQPLYQEILNDITGRIDKLDSRPASVYVRGSIAVGRGIKGLSDIDLVVLYESEPSARTKEAYKDIAERVTHTYSKILDEIDITVTTLSALLYDTEIKNLKIYLKYQSVLLFGNDILDALPEVYPSRNLALYMYGDLANELKSLEYQFKGIGVPKRYQNKERPTRFWCVWLARTVLRSGMALCMAKKPLFTQDLLECKNVVAQHHPELSEMMTIAADFAIHPTDDAQECIRFLETYTANYLKLWQKERDKNDENY